MQELSLHILDIINNSVRAGAKLVTVDINEDAEKDILTITIGDNGSGMDADFLKKVLDPFKTSRTTRKVGLGLSLFRSAAEKTGGDLSISSEKGVGTVVVATFGLSHIDRQPLGDIAGTLTTVISGNNLIDIAYTHTISDKSFCMDTREIKKILEGVDITTPDVIMWIISYINEGIESIRS